MEDNQFLDDQAGHGRVGEVASGLELFVPLREGFADLISKRGRKHDGLGEILISRVVLLDGLDPTTTFSFLPGTLAKSSG